MGVPCHQRHLGFYLLGIGLSVFPAFGQSEQALSQYFEGKQVRVKLDMPATQKGVDIHPNKPQPLDTRSYSDRIKQFGVALRNGDGVMVTKVKLKNNAVEFQLGGGGYGTARDMNDSSVHFTPADKSSREKELEDQLKNETDPDRRRSLSRELDDVRRDRERQDRRNQASAEQDADYRRDQITAGRQQGGSRFNIRFDKLPPGGVTPQIVTEALAQYVDFGPGAALSADNSSGGPPSPPPAGDPAAGLRKGLTRAEVEAIFGPATEAHEHAQDGLSVTTCTYKNAAETVQADFVNGVLVQYKVASR